MNEGIISALLALLGTMMGTFGGIITSSKLTNYRLEQLEKKVDKHNNFALRIPVLEEKIKTVEGNIKNLYEREMLNENFKMDDCPHGYDRFGGC